MLVLSRKTSQRILIANSIRITVLRIDRGGVRLGIEAPSEVPIVREEILLEPIAQNSEWLADGSD